MVIIGERINTINKNVMKAFQERNAEFIRREAINQAASGANVIDLNCGTRIDLEPADMKWAVKTVQESVRLPLCIDSPNPQTIVAGLDACNDKKHAWANSITLERNRIDAIVPIVREYQCPLIALCKDEKGIPETVEGIVAVAKRLVDLLFGYGIPLENVYLDTLIEPISINRNRGVLCLEAIRRIKSEMSSVNTVLCLSAISYGLPERRIINRTYLTLLLNESVDAILLDPTDRRLMTTLKTTHLVLGHDQDCLDYIGAYREGLFREKEA